MDEQTVVEETLVDASGAIEGITAAEGEESQEESEAKAAAQAAIDAETAKKTQEAQASEKFAAKFAALSRKEKEVRAKESAIQKQMAELESRLKSFEAQDQETSKYKALPGRLKQEPLKVLEEAGISFQQLAEMVLNDGKPTQDMMMQEYEKKVMSKVQELETKLAEKEAKEAQEKHDMALGQFQAQLTDFVNNSPDYELIRANDAVDTVYELIEQHYAESQQILSNKEASDAVEEYLLEQAKKLVDRDKVKKLLQPQPPKASVAPNGKSQTTLSNAQAAQAPKSGAAKRMSDEESKAEAAKLLKWLAD